MRLPAASLLLISLWVSLPSLAKLPPPTDEGKAKAAAVASKKAWTDKTAGFQLCNAMNRVAAHYRATAEKTGKPVSAPVDTPACAEVGPFVAQPPLEASGAHSPATTAVAPPSSNATGAELKGSAKK